MITCLFDALDNSARERPDATAFRCAGHALTYSDCVNQTNQLANLLLERGVKRGDRVGIYLHKSLATAVAIFGIMKAGAAFVPVDPRAPGPMLLRIVDSCDLEHLIVDEDTANDVQEHCTDRGIKTIVGCPLPCNLEGATSFTWSQVAAMPASPPDVKVESQDLAYILFTSGSTGIPKGIMHTHESGLAYAQAAAATFDVKPVDVLSNHSALHFDMSTFDYFAGILRGACTVIIPEEYMAFPASLAQLIEEERMTIWYSVTTALTDLMLRGDLQKRDLSCLRMINFGGETFAPANLTALMRMLPHVQFNNLYGPAEVNMCTYFNIPPWPNKYTDRFTPIGRAWHIAESLILDERDNPVSTGEPGELLIASSSRMKGYWKDPVRTAAALYYRAHDNGSTTIFYRTGDIVRDPGDGELEFIGRRDRQVKIRGFRVELDGVEAILVGHPKAAEAAVWVNETKDQKHPTIHGAVLPVPGCTLDAKAMIKYARKELPHYAVPESVSIRTELPRTGTGKIDRRALQAEAKIVGNKN